MQTLCLLTPTCKESVKKDVTTAEYVQSLTQLPCNDNNPSLFSLRRADTQIRLFVVVVK